MVRVKSSAQDTKKMHKIFTSSNFGLLDRGDITSGCWAFFRLYTKLRKATITFAMCVCLSVCPHGTAGLPLDGLSRNFIFECFSKICQQNSSFIIIGQD